jgi:peroxiredoxin
LVLSVALAWIAILAGGWLGWQLLRQNGRILLRLDELEKRLNELEFGGGDEAKGLALGSDAPAFELPDLTGERKSLAQFRGQAVLLIFFNPYCGFCREMMPKLAAFNEGSTGHWPVPAGDSPGGTASAPATSMGSVTTPDAAGLPFGESPNGAGGSPALPRLLILSTGDAEKNRQFFAEHKVGCPVLLQNDGEVAKAYQANGTPAGYLVSADGKIASQLAIGAEALLKLASASRSSRREEAQTSVPQFSILNSEPEDESLLTSAATDGDGRANRFRDRSVARSKLKRDGLKAGTPAPEFRLPRVDGHGELALADLKGKRVLLVFSSPHCGPCNTLAPALEKFYREHAEMEVLMISRGESKENRAKVKEHGLTFPVVLQHQWEISRRYAMFATPIAYLINEQGVIAADVAAGVEPILALLTDANSQAQERELALR